METNDKLKEIYIKNRNCYYLDDIIEFEDFNLDNFLIDKKSYEYILVYKMSYKILVGAKSLHIRFDKIDGFIRVYNGTRYLIIFGAENRIYNKIRYLIAVQSGVFYVFSHSYTRIKVDSHDSLSLEKTLTLKKHFIML